MGMRFYGRLHSRNVKGEWCKCCDPEPCKQGAKRSARRKQKVKDRKERSGGRQETDSGRD